MRSARSLLLLAVLVALAVGACGDDEGASSDGCDDEVDATCAEPPPECRGAEDGSVTVVAKDLAWDVACLEATADEPLMIVVDNQDDGVNHNIRLLDAPSEPKTELEPGPITQELGVTLPPGDFDYICDIHPNMVGTLTMTEANPGDP